MTIRKIVLSLFFSFTFQYAQSQVIISLLLGDNLNTGKVEFGLDGGLNLTSQSGVDKSGMSSNFNLGFYFDIKLKYQWIFHTGVIVKSNMGAGNIPIYSLSQPDLDKSFAGGSITRKLNYFNVPFMMKRYFSTHFFAEAGMQCGLLYNAYDEFTNTIEGDELTYKNEIRKSFHPLDAGIIAGLGYRLMNKYGMNIGVRYYYGLVDVTIDDSGESVKNQSIYFTVGIPIGVGKAREREKEKEKEKNKQVN